MSKKQKTLLIAIAVLLSIGVTVTPIFAATTTTGQLVENLWNNTIYQVIKEVGGTLAIATFVCSAFYFFVIGKSSHGLDFARGLMIGAAIGIVIIYLGPTIINAVIDAVSKNS